MKVPVALVVSFLLLHTVTEAQMKVGENPTNINAGSLLELESSQVNPNGKGFVPPKVSLSALTSTAPLPTGIITGTIVFNTNAVVGTGIGLYYWNGGAVPPTWVAVGTGAASTAWALSGNNTTASNFLGTNNAQDLVLKTNTVERMRIVGGATNTGWIRMGAGTPRSPVDMAGSFADKNILTIQNSAPTGYSSVDLFDDGSNLSGTFGYANGSVTNAAIRGKDYFFIYNKDFLIGTSGNNNGVFYIQNGGNIGINNNVPTEKLDVTGNVRFSGALMPNNNAGTSGLVLTSAGLGAPPTWQTVSGGLAWGLNGTSANAGNFIGTTNATDFVMRTNNVERMRVLSSGNIGIGTTTPGSSLDIKGALRLSGATSGFVGLQSPAAPTASITYTLPAADGTNGQVLTTNGSGTLSWATGGGGSGTGWLITGNTGTNAGTNFIGTTDQQGLTFKVNGVQAGFLGLSGSSYSTSFGVNSNAGYQSTALGSGARANTGNSSIAIGYQALAQNQNSIAIGTTDTASADEGISIGFNARSNAYRGIAIGATAKTSGSTQNIAIGYNANATSFNGIAIGSDAVASTNNNTLALGVSAKSTGFISIALGNGAQATGQNSSAIGNAAIASGLNSTVLGYNAQATADSTIALGANTKATALAATVLGNLSQASKTNSVAVGHGANASGVNSTAIGYFAGASIDNAFVLGNASNNVGIGTSTPTYRLTVVPQPNLDPLYIGGVQQITTYGNGDSVLIIRNGVVKKYKANISSDPGVSPWYTSGNGGTLSSDFIGTTDNRSFRIRTNNIQRMIVDSIGSVGIGSTAFNPNNRERLLVDYGTTTSNTVANFRGGINSHLQINVQNTSSGGKASSNFIATANDGTDTSFYIDMGINGSGFNSGPGKWGGAHDAYLFSKSKRLLIGTQGETGDIIFLAGGGTIKEDADLKIDGTTGNIVVGRGDGTDDPQGVIIRGPRAVASSNVSGGNLTLRAGSGSGTGKGGDLNLTGGISRLGTAGAVNITANPLTIKGVQTTSTFATDSILTIFNGVVKKAPSIAVNGTSWNVTGNTGTNYASNFIGTTDNVSLRFRTNNIQRLIIDSTGNVGIGTSAPDYKLQVVSATDPLYLGGVQGIDSLEQNDSLLIINAGVVKKAPKNAATSGLTIDKYHLTIDLPLIGNNGEVNIDITIPNTPYTVGENPVLAINPDVDLPSGLIVGWIRVISNDTARVHFSNVKNSTVQAQTIPISISVVK